jgi:beta-glucosidase
VENPAEADFAVVQINEPNSGVGYSVDDVKRGGNGYMPVSLQYNDYTATYARATSIAGGDPLEKFTNRSYKGKTVKTSNKDDLKIVLDTKKQMGNKPVIVALSTGRPVVVAEFEGAADAILVTFGVQNQALLDIVSGKNEPSGLLPMQMPANMMTVEQQNEDVPRDMVCYKDADGNTYDFAFGLNWSGVINDARVAAYK